MEAGIWRTDLGAPLNFTTVARISGPLTADALRAALPAVRARHAHLRARIVNGPPPSFTEEAVPLLSLSVVQGTDWVKELEREINELFERSGPLARFVLVADRLLITLHHTVGDGMSGVYLARAEQPLPLRAERAGRVPAQRVSGEGEKRSPAVRPFAARTRHRPPARTAAG